MSVNFIYPVISLTSFFLKVNKVYYYFSGLQKDAEFKSIPISVD